MFASNIQAGVLRHAMSSHGFHPPITRATGIDLCEYEHNHITTTGADPYKNTSRHPTRTL